MSNQSEVLIDSDTLSLFLKNYPNVIANANIYLNNHSGFTFTLLTRFEILRGLKAKNAKSQIVRFEAICSYSTVLGLNDSIILNASDIYADLHQSGQLISHADILIAATALENGLAVVTNNENHFNRIKGLQVINWNK